MRRDVEDDQVLGRWRRPYRILAAPRELEMDASRPAEDHAVEPTVVGEFINHPEPESRAIHLCGA
jgi:hypothetical protein